MQQALQQSEGMNGAEPNDVSGAVDPNLEIYRQMYASMQRNSALDRVFEENNIGEIDQYMGVLRERYTERNQEPLLQQKEGMTPEEQFELSRQLDPIIVDPNEIADMRQRLVKLDIAMKQVDPSFSVYTHSKTAKVANWLAREAGPFTPGYIKSGEQGYESAGETMPVLQAFGEGVTDFGLNAVYNVIDWTGMAMDAITGGKVSWAGPTNYVEDENGNLVFNGGKIPGLVDTIAAVNARVMGQNVQEYMARVREARSFEQMHESKMESIIRGAATVAGMGFGFGLPAGKAMAVGTKVFGKLTQKGLMQMAVSGSSPRMVKLATVMSETAGAAVGNGFAEMVAFGRQDGLGKAFTHGLAMAPVLTALGAMGKGAEKYLGRKRMPKFVSQGVSGALEGIGFGALEQAQTGALWRMMQDPSQTTWEIYAKNMLGFAVFKVMAGRGMTEEPVAGEQASRFYSRGKAREALGEEVSRADEGIHQPGAEGILPGSRQLPSEGKGELDQSGPPGQPALRGGERYIPGAKEKPVADPTKPDMATRIQEELRRLKSESPTPENRERVIELLNEARGTVAEKTGEMVAAEYAKQQPTADALRTAEARSTGEGAPRREPLTATDRPAQVSAREFANRGEMREATAAEAERAASLDARVEASKIPRESLRELGNLSRAARAAETPYKAGKIRARQREVEQELDALEMAQDPVTNATMREAIRERELEELNAEGDVIKGKVNPEYGERTGPESMREHANPHRQQKNLLKPGEEPVRASEIIDQLRGQPGFPGIRILSKRIGKIAGSAVQVAIKAGKIAGQGTAGVFKIYENLTRTKEGMDLVVSLHEWSHAMQRQVQIGKGGPDFMKGVERWARSMPEAVINDMVTILRNYPGSGKMNLATAAAEAWAEWHARNLLGDATLRNEAPDLTRWMDAWLINQPKLMKQYGQVKAMVDIYKRQGARERVRMSIQRGKTKVPGSPIERIISKMEGGWDAVVKSLFDDMHLLKKSQRKWLAVAGVDPASLSILDDPSRLMDAVAMTAQKQAESFISRGTHNLALERTGEGLEAVFNDVGKGLKGRARNDKTIDFIDYVVATRALELIGHGKKQTLPKADYIQAQKELIEANPEFKGLSHRMKRWSDSLLDLVAEAGNLPEADVKRMKDYSTVYIPFVRAMQDAVATRGTRGVAEKGNSVKSLKGDRREITDPMIAMLETTTTMIAKAHQQMVMKALYKMTMKTDIGGMATKVDRTNVPSQYRLDQVFKQMQKSVLDRLQKDGFEDEYIEGWEEAFGMFGDLIGEANVSDQMITLFGQKVLPFGEGANIIAYTPRLTEGEINSLPEHRQSQARKDNGKMQWLEVEGDVYTALLGLDQPVSGRFVDAPIVKATLGRAKNMVRFFATDANPAFTAANLIRDAMSRPVFDSEGRVSANPLNGMVRVIQGAALLASKDTGKRAIVDMYEASGAKTASLHNEGVRRQMRGEVIGKLGVAKETLQKALDKWTNWMGTPESFLRVDEFARVHKKAIAEGKSTVEAAIEALEGAKEITVNFARAGTLARAYNQITPYFSASFAGQRKMLRAITGMEGTNDFDRGRMQAAAIANGIIGITAPSMAIWALTYDTDWYRDLPEWRKKHFMNMKVGGTIVSLPLPFEMGTVFGSMPMMFADKATDSNPIDFLPAFAESMFPYLNGMSGLLPAGLKPILESHSGYDFFTGRQQTPFWIGKTRVPAEQMRAGTTASAKALYNYIPNAALKTLGIDNPIELEHFMSGYTAGGFSALARMADEVSGMKDHPGLGSGMDLAYSSFLNRFAKQTPHGASRTVDEFYDLATKIEQRGRGKSRTREDKRMLRDINRDRQRMADIRGMVDNGQLSRVDGDRMIFEIASKRMETTK